MVSLFYFPGIGTLRDYDGDGNGNFKNTIGFMSKTNDPILSWLENANGKTINLTVSLLTRVHGSPLFSSKLNSLLLSNWVTWYEGKKIERAQSLFFSDAFMGVTVVGSFLAFFYMLRSRGIGRIHERLKTLSDRTVHT